MFKSEVSLRVDLGDSQTAEAWAQKQWLIPYRQLEHVVPKIQPAVFES